MIRYTLLLIASFCWTSVSAQSIDTASDPLKTPVKFENALPEKESILDLDLYRAYSGSTVLFQPRSAMDFSYVKYAVAWPSLDIPVGSSPVSYGRAHFTSTGNLSLHGVNVLSVVNLDFKSVARGEGTFVSNYFLNRGPSGQENTLFGLEGKKLFLTTALDDGRLMWEITPRRRR